MNINGNLKTPCNIYGICGYKQSGKNTVAKIWQLLDYYYNTVYKGEDFNNRPKIDIDFVLHYLNNNEIQYININSKEDVNKISTWQEKSFAHSLKKILCILYGFKIEDFESEEFKSKELPEAFWYWYMELDGGYGPIILPYTSPKPPKGYEGLKLIKPTPRMLLQKIGTDLFRNQLHPNIWVNALFVDYKSKFADRDGFVTSKLENGIVKWKPDPIFEPFHYPNWIITDIRFQNEADAVTERGGKLIKVVRYKVGDKVWFNDEAGLYEDKNQSGEYTIIGIHSNEEYLISNGTTEIGAWNYEIKHINKDTHASEVEQDSIPVYYTIHNSTTLEDLIASVKYIMIEEGVIKV